MSVEWVVGLLVVVAIACVGGAAFLFFRESWFMQWLRGTAGFLLVGIAAWLVFVSAALFSFQQVRDQAPLATVSLAKAGDQAWTVTVAEANGDRRVFPLKGDLWNLDVRMLRFGGMASVFGAQPAFQLDRLYGQYLTVEDEQNKDHAEFNLAARPFLGVDLWRRAADHGSLMFNATLANVSLVPASEGAIYEVALGEDGLLRLHPANSAAEQALANVAE